MSITGAHEPHIPRRGDEVEQWLQRHHDGEMSYRGDEQMSDLLDDYRRHADAGVPLSEEVPGG